MSAAMPLRWLWYLVRVLFCAAYAVVAFFSKPGARWIVTAGLAVAAWPAFPWVVATLDQTAVECIGDAEPVTLLMATMAGLTLAWLAYLAAITHGAKWLALILLFAWFVSLYSFTQQLLIDESAARHHVPLHAAMAGTLLLLCLFALAAVARVLALVLGTFPPPAWPLRPRPVLKAKNRVIAPVPVALAVPRLRPPATRPPDELHAALPPEVAALLNPRHPPALP